MSLRPTRSYRVAFALILILRLAGSASGAASKSYDPLDWLRALKAAPNTEAIAAREGFVLHGIQAGSADAKPQAGDAVTALVELGPLDGKQPAAQWLVRLQLAAKLSADSAKPRSSEATQYTNTGEKFTFYSDQARMRLETLGPIKAVTKPDQRLPVKHREISVATDFLSLDLYRTALVLPRLRDSHGKLQLALRTGPKPYPAGEVNVQRPRALALNLTADDQRSFSGSLPALMQFLDIVRSTPDLQAILFQVLDKPSLIDVFRSGANDTLNFNFLGGGHADGSELFWPGAKTGDFGTLAFDLVIFQKPVLTVVLYVTTPRAPLLVSAGIVGVVAFKPKPDMADKFVVIRVLSATAGAGMISPSKP